MPSTLPFDMTEFITENNKESEADKSKLEQLFERLDIKGQKEMPKIGKLRVMKSGKVVMRI